MRSFASAVTESPCTRKLPGLHRRPAESPAPERHSPLGSDKKRVLVSVGTTAATMRTRSGELAGVSGGASSIGSSNGVLSSP